MTNEQKNRIIELRKQGVGYILIAQELSISENTVKSFCRRNNLTSKMKPEEISVDQFSGEEEGTFPCQYCGKPVMQTPGRKRKKFCCDRHRNLWWNSHLDQVHRKAMYEYTCPTCGKTFTAYGNRNRKYCSHECYIEHRFGGAQ